MLSFFQTRFVSFAFSVSKFNAAKDYYKILNVSSNADQKQIKKSFRELAKKYHPDSNKGNEDKFKEINQAYQVLSSQIDKKDYDQARNYESTKSQNPYNAQNSGSAYNGYQNNPYSNQQYNQQYYQQSSFYSTDYRGYQKTTGWQNAEQRDKIMYEMYKKQQQYMNGYNRQSQQQRHKQGRSNYAGGFESMYANSTFNPQKIKKYTQQIRAKQEAIRKAYEQEERRRQQEFKKYQDKQYMDMKQKMQQKIYKAAQGVSDNIKGFFKMANFVKSIWNDAKQTILKDKDEKDAQNKNKGKK